MNVHQGIPVSGCVNHRMTFSELTLQFPLRTHLIQGVTVTIKYRQVIGTLPQGA